MSILAVSRSSCVPWVTAPLSSRTDPFMTRTITRTPPSFAPLFRLRLFGQWANSHQVLYRLDHQTTWGKSSFPFSIGTSDVIQELWLE